MTDNSSPEAVFDFRPPTPHEQALIERLLSAEFPGKRELQPLMRDVLVRTIDEDGGLELRSQTGGSAPVVKRIPVEAEARDQDGAMIHMLLHVVEGRPIELEFFKENGTRVQRMPSPDDFQLIILSPAPAKHWRPPQT